MCHLVFSWFQVNDLAALAIEVLSLGQTFNDDLGPSGYYVFVLVLPDSLGPIGFRPPLFASGDDMVLFGNLSDSPHFEIIKVFHRPAYLVESVISPVSIDREFLFVLGGLCCAFPTQDGSKRGEVVVFYMLMPFWLHVAT